MTTQTNDPGADAAQAAKLPIVRLVVEAYALLTARRADLVRIFWLPGLVLTVTSWRLFSAQAELMRVTRMQASTTGMTIDVSPSTIGMFDYLGIAGVNIMFMAAVFVAVLRMVMTDERAGSPVGAAVGKRELRFIGYGIALHVLASMPILALLVGGVILKILLAMAGIPEGTPIIGILMVVAMVGVVIVSVAIFLRLWLVLPKIAMDVEGGMKEQFRSAWDVARGHTLRVFTVLLLAMLPIAVVEIVGNSLFVKALWSQDTSSQHIIAYALFTAVVTLVAYGVLAIILARIAQFLDSQKGAEALASDT